MKSLYYTITLLIFIPIPLFQKVFPTMSSTSLYIPFVFTSIDENHVRYVFETYYCLGKIKRVDFISKIGNNSVPYNSVYIHFEYWFKTPAAESIRNRIINQDPNDPQSKVHLLYNEIKGFYWIVLENKSKRIVSGEKKEVLQIERKGILKRSNVDKKVRFQVSENVGKTNKYFSDLVNNQ